MLTAEGRKPGSEDHRCGEDSWGAMARDGRCPKEAFQKEGRCGQGEVRITQFGFRVWVVFVGFPFCCYPSPRLTGEIHETVILFCVPVYSGTRRRCRRTRRKRRKKKKRRRARTKKRTKRIERRVAMPCDSAQHPTACVLTQILISCAPEFFINVVFEDIHFLTCTPRSARTPRCWGGTWTENKSKIQKYSSVGNKRAAPQVTKYGVRMCFLGRFAWQSVWLVEGKDPYSHLFLKVSF